MKRYYIKSLIVGFGLLLAFGQAYAAVFSDVASNHPNYNAINYLYEKGVIQGYSDNTFRPEQKVNRAEALKIILLGSGILVPEIQQQDIFPDVLYSAWYAKYALKAKNLGIIKGDDVTGYFRPGDNVILAEALKILLKANNKTVNQPTSNPYLDVPKDSWFAPYFDYAIKAGLLDQKTTDNVYPATPVTRAMLAELMYRLATSKFIVADGKASFYSDTFHGKTTASGAIYDASAFTAAHRTYPFGTWLKVTNAENSKSVVVEVNDRGPYVSDPTRIIDLSKAAFESIALLSSGIINVKIEETTAPSTPQIPQAETTTPSPTIPSESVPTGDLLNTTKIICPEVSSLEFLPKTTFSNITLDDEIPNRIILNEVLTLKGSTTVKTNTVSAFILDSNNNQTAFTGDLVSGKFAINIRFQKEGTYQLGILPGESGKSVIKEIKVIKNTCIGEAEDSKLPPVTGIDMYVQDGNTEIEWNPGNYNLFKLTFSQGGLHKSYILKKLSKWEPVPKEFASFKASDTELSIRGAIVNNKSILEPDKIMWSPASTKNFIASDHYEYIFNAKEAEIISLTNSAIVGNTIKAVFKPKVPVRSKAAVILPTGKVKEIILSGTNVTPVKNAVGIEVFPSSGETLTASYTEQTTGVHFLEINNAEGLAVINVPVYIKNQFPLLPNIRDLSDQNPINLGNDISGLRTKMLALLNADRSKYKLSPLKLDTALSNLAQFRSDDMAANNYFSHWDKNGNDANDLRPNYGIITGVSENLAKDLTLELAEYGLMRSAIHRSNILSEEWTRVGFGISRLPDGSYDFVQIFSEEPLNMSDMTSLRASVLSKINANRASALTLKDNLNSLAQSWSEKMANEDFFDFTDKNGASLVDMIRNSGVNASLGTYIVGNSSFAAALDQVGGNAQLTDSKWKFIGIGVKQDNLGIIKITLIYTE